ncbi:hypothetical protein R75461_01171 [Paraburkholderia nemoris]|nr:hypothetical protein R75461_01171 [Paraburkholderia nemoris]
MVTLHRRRQWRDKRARPTLDDLMHADAMIGIHCALAGIFTVLIILVALLGQDFVNLLFGD